MTSMALQIAVSVDVLSSERLTALHSTNLSMPAFPTPFYFEVHGAVTVQLQ